MWRACFHVFDGGILQVKDNSTGFLFFFLQHFTLALMMFILWWSDKERHSSPKALTVSLILHMICLHLFADCCRICKVKMEAGDLCHGHHGSHCKAVGATICLIKKQQQQKMTCSIFFTGVTINSNSHRNSLQCYSDWEGESTFKYYWTKCLLASHSSELSCFPLSKEPNF